MNTTAIEWTDFTANALKFRTPDGRVVWACEKTSPGCAHCYADQLSVRYNDRRAGEWTAETMATLTPFLDERELHKMLTYKPASGKRVFVGDMTDIFGAWVPDELLDRLFAVFALRPDVTFQILTKRAERMRRYLADASEKWGDRRDGIESEMYALGGDDDARTITDEGWPLPNVWLGVSVENQRFADERIPLLLQTPAVVRFISAEPLLGEVNLAAWLPHAAVYIPAEDSPSGKRQMRCIRCSRLTAGMERECRTFNMQPLLDWIIVGGESGPSSRPFDVAWARSIVQQCQAAGVPVFVKQLGGAPRTSEFDAVPMTANGFPLSERPATTVSGGLLLRDRKGGDPSEWPADIRVREFPEVARV